MLKSEVIGTIVEPDGTVRELKAVRIDTAADLEEFFNSLAKVKSDN